MNILKFNQIEFNHIGEQPTSSIKLQEKSVTITENGSQEIVPDKGYGLGKVNVKTNVNTSDLVYLLYDFSSDASDILIAYTLLIKSKFRNESVVITSWQQIFQMGVSYFYYIAVAIDPNAVFSLIQDDGTINNYTFKEVCNLYEINYNSLPFITKEEFYDLTTE